MYCLKIQMPISKCVRRSEIAHFIVFNNIQVKHSLSTSIYLQIVNRFMERL